MDEPRSKRRLGKLIVILVVILVATGLAYLFFRPTEMTLPVSIRFKDLPEGLVVVGKVSTVEAHLTGRAGILADLKDSALLYQVDMASVEPGKTFHEIAKGRIAVPTNVTVISVDPASFVIRVDKEAEKRVPVVPDLVGEPAPGYVVSSMSALPARVRITGPESIVNQISAVRTTPIDLSGIKGPAKRNVALSLNDHDEIEVSGNGLVEVAIEIEKRMIERWIEREVRPEGTDLRCEVRPSHIQVLLKGPENVFKDVIEHRGIDVRVDLKGLGPGTYFRHAVVEPPLDMVVLETEPSTFKVELFPEPTADS